MLLGLGRELQLNGLDGRRGTRWDARSRGEDIRVALSRFASDEIEGGGEEEVVEGVEDGGKEIQGYEEFRQSSQLRGVADGRLG